MSTQSNSRMKIAALLAALAFTSATLGNEAMKNADRRGVVSPIGTWNLVLHLPFGDEPIAVSIHVDGTISTTQVAHEIPCGTDMCKTGMSSLGMWHPTGHQAFEFANKEYWYDSSGNLAIFLIAHYSCTLASYAETFSCGVVAEQWSIDGQQIPPLFYANADASRMNYPPY